MVELKDLKVCFLAGTLGRGGAERQLIYMLKALKQASVQTRVLCLTKGEPLEKEIRELGISVTWVGKSRWRLIRLFRIIQQLRRERPHILQSAHFYANIYVAIAAQLLRLVSIGAIRANVTGEMTDSGRLGAWQLRLPTYLIANSEAAKVQAIAKGIAPDRIDLVQNAVDIRSTKQNGSQNSNRNLEVLFAGRLCEQKRPDRFLRVLRSIVEHRPSLYIKGTVAGEGPLLPRMEELAAQLGLSPNHIKFVGEIKDLLPLYQKSDVLILTSDWEGTPNVLLEAMCCGLPVVATRVGGVPEIINGERGLTVDPNDEVALTAATLKIIDDANLRTALGRQGQEYVSHFHSLNALARRLTAIYQRILCA